MADFFKWVTACEGALWAPGTFAVAYKANLEDAVSDQIEFDLVAQAIVDLMNRLWDRERVKVWEGTCTTLLRELSKRKSDYERKLKEWPQGPRALRSRLNRVSVPLGKIGITLRFLKPKGGHARDMEIRRR
jgi:hypothetical protein